MSNIETPHSSKIEKKPYVKPEIKQQPQFQNRDPFEDFLSNVEPSEERRKPTTEEIKNLDANLKALSALLADFDIAWQLDGALNISIMNGDYIGVHKDIDLSVEAADFKKLEKHLLKKGYGLFLSYKKEQENPKSQHIFERVDAESIINRGEHPMIAAMDKRGKLLENVPLNFLDVHIVKRNKEGQAVGYGDVPFPEKWTKPLKAEFKGQELNISQPARVAYFKLHQDRVYDRTDLLALADTGKLTEDDIEEIDQLMLTEYEYRVQRAKDILKGIEPHLSVNSTAKDIYNLLMQQPLLAEKGKSITKQVEQLASSLAQLPDKSFDSMMALFMQTSKIKDRFQGQKIIIESLKSRLVDNKKLEKVRKGLE